MAHTHAPLLRQARTHELVRRIDDIGAALFLILTGVLWMMLDTRLPPGTWLITTGLLLLGLNVVRLVVKVPVSLFLLAMGVLTLAAGLTAYWRGELPLAGVCLFLLGSGMLARELHRAA